MSRALLLAAVVLPVLLCGCPFQDSPGARAQEAANDLNLNARFGRMELATESVSPKERDDFLQHRRGWGGKVRIADYELTGLKMKSSGDADVFVKVAWFRIDEGDLHVTTLQQQWHEYTDAWRLTGESRLDGDVGLIGEPTPPVPAKTGPRNMQFPTIRLGSD